MWVRRRGSTFLLDPRRGTSRALLGTAPSKREPAEHNRLSQPEQVAISLTGCVYCCAIIDTESEGPTKPLNIYIRQQKNNSQKKNKKMSVVFTGNVRDAIRRMVSSGAFVLEEGVPIFGSHSRDLPGGKKVVVSDDDLPEICRNTHELFNGYFPCVTIGHRNHSPNAREIDQPPVVGFIVGLEPRDGVIFADLLIYRHKLSDYISYPYRSAEYVAESKTIVGLAVLTRPPFLGIGTKIESIEYSPGRYPNLSRNRVRDADLVFKRV